MTVASASNLSRAKIHRLLQAVGSAPRRTEPDAEVSLYDWRDPHYFNQEQRNGLAALMGEGATLLAERFIHFYHCEFDARIVSIREHYAADLADHVRLDGGFSLPFGTDTDQPCGFLAVAREAGLVWATRLLGDADSSSDPDRAISSLEESLLTDLLTAGAEAILGPLESGNPLKVGGQLYRACPTMPYGSTDEMCHIIFEIQGAKSEEKAELSFVLPCSVVAPAVGKASATDAQPSKDQLVHLLMEHVQQMPVTVTARLAAVCLSFKEVFDLGCDDVLLLEKPIEEPLDVIVDGRTILRGRPARSNGHYAIFVTDSTVECAGQAVKPPTTR